MSNAGGRRGPVLLAPLRLEAAAARRGARDAHVECIGMGPARATAARARLERELAPGQPVVLLGLAGGLVAGQRAGDVLVGSSVATLGSGGGVVRSGDTIQLPTAPAILGLLRDAGIAATSAALVCSPTIVRGDAARHEAAAQGAVAVEMESYWCAPLGERRPFAVVRVLLDIAGHDLVSLSTAAAGVRALRTLSLVARAVSTWSPDNVKQTPLQEVGDR